MNLSKNQGSLFIVIVILGLLVAGYQSLQAAIINVPADYPTIQAAIDQAVYCDEIIVQPGQYYENLQFHGVNITLRSVDPADPASAETTIIDGQNMARVVSFDGSETETCALAGFTIRNGLGGINGNGTHATIERNIIRENLAPMTSGGFFPEPGRGGGILECHGLIQFNTIRDNWAVGATFSGGSGGGLFDCDGVIQNNLIENNTAGAGYRYNYLGGSGGGLAACNGMIINNIIANNTAQDNTSAGTYYGYGGGLASCNIIMNCTIYGNTGEGISTAGHVINSIIWGNQRPSNNIVLIENSCVDNSYYLQPQHPGNVSCDPHLANPAGGDYSLLSTSICIDGGRAVPQVTTDYFGLSRPVDATTFDIGDGAGYDMGAIELQTPILNPPPLPDRNGVVEIPNEYLHTISSAIYFVNDASTVVVQPGTYYENIKFYGKNIRLCSTDPTNPDVVKATIIDGQRRGSVIEFDGSEQTTCVLEGLTIQNGSAKYGGGIKGNSTLATIRFNRIVNNLCFGKGRWDGDSYSYSEGLGGGIYKCDGVIEHNVISNNIAKGGNGGGIGGCMGVVRNNLIAENIADLDPYYMANYGGQGGAMRDVKYCYNNTIVGNSAVWGGAGSNVEIVRNCIIWYNGQTESPQQVIHNWPEVYDVAWSCVQDWGAGGEGILTIDPGFADPQSGSEWRLKSDSPCIDAGIALDGVTSDLEGTPRPLIVLASPGGDGSGVDMGAYEFVVASEETIRNLVLERWPLTEGLRLACDLDGDMRITVADLILFLIN